VLRQLANGIDAAGRRVHRTFLAPGRVLGEGVDITGQRGVEAVCFADTRGCQVEIVQNIGRALRLNKDGSTKVARIIVPVFLEPGEDPTDMVTSASFRPLVAVLQGLRSHDERAGVGVQPGNDRDGQHRSPRPRPGAPANGQKENAREPGRSLPQEPPASRDAVL
jgi:predicted helicase